MGTAREIRGAPDDFAIQAPLMTLPELKLFYKTGARQVRRWIAETGVKAKAPDRVILVRFTPAPADFTQVAPLLSRNGLAAHYGVSSTAINRWINETGAVPKVYIPVPPQSKVNRSSWTRTRPGDFQIAKTRTATVFDDAADTLRRHCPVYRCDDRGRYDERGQFWRMGNALLTPGELLQRAERKRL